MKSSTRQLVIAVILGIASSSCTVMDQEAATEESEVFTQPKPDYPISEFERRREGWVLVAYSVSRGGIVDDLYVKDSSGNSKFEEAALNGVRQWRYVPGEQRELTALISFSDGEEGAAVSRRFGNQYRKAQDLIDEGKLDEAQALLTETRAGDYLHPSELAYSYLAEGRIANERGETARQLNLYRKAMLDNGRWLTRDDYRGVLYFAVILALDQGDFVSAVHDYDVLTESRSGRKFAENLEELVRAARAYVDTEPSDVAPYAVADSSMAVVRRHPREEPSGKIQEREPGSGRHGFYNPKKAGGGSERD